MGDDKLLVVRPIVTNAKPIRAMAGVSNPKPVHVETGDPDYLMYLEETRDDGALVVFNVDNSDSPDAKFKKVNTVQDQDALNDVLEIEWCDVSDPKSSTKTFVDPDYKMFMENMKIDGHFFSLELHENDGSSEILEYEKDVYQKEYWGKLTGDNVENASGKHTRDLVVNGEDTVTKSTKNINKGKEKEVINLVVNGDNSDSPDAKFKKVNTVQDQDALNDVLEIEWCDVSDPKSSTKTFVDPDYKMITENMKIDGHFFSLELHENDGSSEILEYEKDVYQKEYWGKLTGDNVENASGKHTRDLVVNGEDTVTKSLRENINKGKEKEVINLGSSKEKKNVLVGRERISRESNKSMATKSRSVVQRGDDVQIVAIKNANEIDKHTVSKVNKNKRPLDLDGGHEMEYLRKSKRSKYKKVERRRSLTRIDNVSKVKEENLVRDSDVVMVKGRRQKVQVRNRVYIPNLQPPTKYDENFGKYAEVKKEYDDSSNYEEMDNGHASDLEILDMNDQQNLSRFEVSRVFKTAVIEDNPPNMKTSSDYENPEFREELIDILKMPYNQQEYKNLMQKANYRHMKGGSEKLKGRKVPDIYGKSPLEYHPDVKRRLRQSRVPAKRLNILRGFIYWYERVCKDGAFKPWLDKSCSAVTPRPRK